VLTHQLATASEQDRPDLGLPGRDREAVVVEPAVPTKLVQKSRRVDAHAREYQTRAQPIWIAILPWLCVAARAASASGACASV
jgi:hypothetical protein